MERCSIFAHDTQKERPPGSEERSLMNALGYYPEVFRSKKNVLIFLSDRCIINKKKN